MSATLRGREIKVSLTCVLPICKSTFVPTEGVTIHQSNFSVSQKSTADSDMDDSSQGITVDINGDEWKEFPAPENNPHYWVLLSEIEKSKSDDRNCKFIKLKNGFQILLIQDSDTDIAAVAMNVGVGYLSDPVRIYLALKRLYLNNNHRMRCQDWPTSASM